MSSLAKGIFRIGTSGIVVPGTKESFPPEFQLKSRLNYYSSLFNTLEINSTFHKLPMTSTFEKWGADVSENFQLTIKLWKQITHIKKLKIDLDNIPLFLKAADRVGDKKGCLLVQFPGSITLEFYNEVEQILLKLHEVDRDSVWRKAVEFRSDTWYVGEGYELLKSINASLVLHDMPKSKNLQPMEWDKFFYFRFHGPTGNYRGSYSNGFLHEQSEKIRVCIDQGKDVYAYFNNTMGTAYDDAMCLKVMVEK
ncbi:DUF72 domain-containing protein [Segetibacter sp.]|jgi:uncharacterized protein YecE (DUF72 family)|uniref:DUF72 domain-containing protein n=1 Tax=Segetibacter sp. TaxID=2231182 RepID=UPI00260BA92C|nr:DUF72 domain-containing protein [Segetibacter sp.]MCW3080210.1 hypothetical protein [Segetibacter sp.]